MFKKIVMAVVGLIVVLAAILLINTLSFSSKQIKYEEVRPVTVDDNVVENLTRAIQFQTVSLHEDSLPAAAEFEGFHKFLAAQYPLIDSLLEKTVINDYSLLYEWKGSNPELKPIIMLSHQDVVPIDEPTRDQWVSDPFLGQVKDGKIYGRGTMDDKGTLIALMEAVERLLSEGYSTQRTIYLAFGHDEEIGGSKGARAIANYLRTEGVRAEFTIDEGGVLAEGQIPGLDNTVAVINVAEKGYVSYEMTVKTDGGHSSQPPADNTIGVLARSITKLENNQFPFKIVKPLDHMINYIGPELPFLQKLVFANSWLFETQIANAFNGRTTTAPTIIDGGVKDNVIPTVATATINFRILPGESSAMVLDHINALLQDEYVTVKAVGHVSEPSPVSDPESPSFKILQRTIGELYPDTIVVPGLVGGGTDSRYFTDISDNVYRFYPIRYNNDNKNGFHGINEYMSVENFKECIQFAYQLVKNVNL